jgi:Copper type II ascorbate-dependent monooxygenase, C-terminal domain
MRRPRFWVRGILLATTLLVRIAAPNVHHSVLAASSSPTFYKNILPILQQHCQVCHRAGEIAPMALVTYSQAHRYAAKMKQMTSEKMMPPWFADPRFGHFSNDNSLAPEQIATIASWADAGAPAGDPSDTPPPAHWTKGWNIPEPDLVIGMPKPVTIPARGDVQYTYEIVPTGFKEDKWVQASEIRPISREHVHHAVVYIRPPSSKWLRNAPLGRPFSASDMTTDEDVREALFTDSDMLLVYAPGSSPDQWPDGMAKCIPAGSDLVFQMHYTTNGHATTDQTSVGMVFAKQSPKQRVLTLQLTNHSFVIPPEADNFRVEVFGTMPNDAMLLSFFPHMHLRGKRFEYDIVHPDGSIETLLRVNYHFHWQMSYKLAEPSLLKAGTKLQAVAWFDNSKNNPHNPDPEQTVRWGGQTYEEMMVGFFDLAVPANVDKWQYFVRHTTIQ